MDIFKVLDHDCLRKISIIELENYMEWFYNYVIFMIHVEKDLWWSDNGMIFCGGFIIVGWDIDIKLW